MEDCNLAIGGSGRIYARCSRRRSSTSGNEIQFVYGVLRRRFDVLLCWKVDRFGRSLKHLVDAIADLDSYGVAFVSLRDNLDLSTPSGRLMMQIVGAMAEFERSLIQERVISGLRNANQPAIHPIEDCR